MNLASQIINIQDTEGTTNDEGRKSKRAGMKRLKFICWQAILYILISKSFIQSAKKHTVGTAWTQ